MVPFQQGFDYFLQVDKLLQSVHSTLWAYCYYGVVYQVNDPVDKGGFHLPWWYGYFIRRRIQRTGNSSQHCLYRNVILNYCIWLTFTRTLKLMPHLWNRPEDIIYIPAFVAFGYCFEFMKLYALLTLHKVSYIRRRFFK